MDAYILFGLALLCYCSSAMTAVGTLNPFAVLREIAARAWRQKYWSLYKRCSDAERFVDEAARTLRLYKDEYDEELEQGKTPAQAEGLLEMVDFYKAKVEANQKALDVHIRRMVKHWKSPLRKVKSNADITLPWCVDEKKLAEGFYG